MQDIAIVESPDALGSCSLLQIASCMRTLTILMDLVDQPLPPVLVLHVSPKVAAAFGVDETGIIRHNRTGDFDLKSYYELWLVGQPDASNYVHALMGILEDHFLLDVSADVRQRALESALWLASSKAIETATVQ